MANFSIALSVILSSIFFACNPVYFFVKIIFTENPIGLVGIDTVADRNDGVKIVEPHFPLELFPKWKKVASLSL